MTRTFDVSGRLPDDVVEALQVLDHHFREARIRYVVIGALARDAVTSLIQDRVPQRATKDVDLAVRVSSMEQFRDVTSGLERVGRHEHKFRVAGLEIDVVPFGGIAVDGRVEFRESVLDVHGLEEASQTSERVKVTDSLSVDVASVAALTVLKILAWRDRKAWTNKDAIDLEHLFSAVQVEPYRDEIWSDEEAAELVEYDGTLLGAAWLGRQARRIADESSLAAVEGVLNRHLDALAHDMRAPSASDQLRAFVHALHGRHLGS